MIIIDDHTTNDLDKLALDHYNYLIGSPLVDGINYHATASLIGRIRRQKNLDEAIPDQLRVDFWDYLLDDEFENLIRVITSRPNILQEIIKEIENLFGRNFFSNDIDYERATLNDFGKIVRTVFNYRSYRDNPECANKCNQFNLLFCPYCNSAEVQVITEINNLTGNEERQALLQLDHFYPQSRHPYFSVSFFNLIPGCSPCNAHIKKEKRFDIDTHFNPFNKRLDEYFKFELKNLIINEESDIEFIVVNKKDHPMNALTDFKILTRYSANKRMIFKMYKSFRNRSPKLRTSLSQQIVGLFIAESKTKILLDNYNIPLNRDEINSVQLGKLKRDIAIQLGMLNI